MLANKLKIGDTIGVIAPDKALKNKDIKYLENILADTKMKFGIDDNKLILADEILTPDCSRFKN